MSKDNKNKHSQSEHPEQYKSYYSLHSKAVDDLVNADESNSPEVSKEELRKYKGSKTRIAPWIKIMFIKFWFPASVCFFVIWGLGLYIQDTLDLLFVTGLALGIVTDLLTNKALRFFADNLNTNDKWIMITIRNYWSYPLNILYAWLLLFLVYTLYGGINGLIVLASGKEEVVPLGVEPILFGLFYLGFDLLLIFGKHLLKKIFNDAKKSVSEGR